MKQYIPKNGRPLNEKETQELIESDKRNADRYTKADAEDYEAIDETFTMLKNENNPPSKEELDELQKEGEELRLRRAEADQEDWKAMNEANDVNSDKE